MVNERIALGKESKKFWNAHPQSFVVSKQMIVSGESKPAIQQRSAHPYTMQTRARARKEENNSNSILVVTGDETPKQEKQQNSQTPQSSNSKARRANNTPTNSPKSPVDSISKNGKRKLFKTDSVEDLDFVDVKQPNTTSSIELKTRRLSLENGAPQTATPDISKSARISKQSSFLCRLSDTTIKVFRAEDDT